MNASKNVDANLGITLNGTSWTEAPSNKEAEKNSSIIRDLAIRNKNLNNDKSSPNPSINTDIEEMGDKLESVSKSISEDIVSLFSTLKIDSGDMIDVNNLQIISAEVVSLKSTVLQYLRKLKFSKLKVEKERNKQYNIKNEWYTSKYQHSISQYERNRRVENDIDEYQKMVELYDIYIDDINGNIKTLDSFQYIVKNIIEVSR